jgi:hypothetical protein
VARNLTVSPPGAWNVARKPATKCFSNSRPSSQTGFAERNPEADADSASAVAHASPVRINQPFHWYRSEQKDFHCRQQHNLFNYLFVIAGNAGKGHLPASLVTRGGQVDWDKRS